MNIDIFWRSNVNDVTQKNDVINVKILKGHVENLINENKKFQIELKLLKSLNEKLIDRTNILEKKWFDESKILRELIHEKTVYVKDIEFKRILRD